jgi:hypothetical protein
VKIEPGFYKGVKDGKTVILCVYGKHPFLRVDMIETVGRKDVAMHSLVNNIDPDKLGIEFIESIDNLNVEEV